MELTNEHKEILNHTKYRAVNKFYCGDSKEMQELCSAGLMRSVGSKSFVPDEYFTITSEGRVALNNNQTVQRHRRG